MRFQVDALTCSEMTKESVREKLTAEGEELEGTICEVLAAAGQPTVPIFDQGRRAGFVCREGALGLGKVLYRGRLVMGRAAIVQDLAWLRGMLNDGEAGILVAWEDVEPDVRDAARREPVVQLLSSLYVLNLFVEHYDRLTIHTQAIVPLARILVPLQVDPKSAPRYY